jgi:hypothetical protein
LETDDYDHVEGSSLFEEVNPIEFGVPAPDADGYDWAIEEIRAVANTLAAHRDPNQRAHGPRHSLRVFNLINQLVDLIPADNDEPNPDPAG